MGSIFLFSAIIHGNSRESSSGDLATDWHAPVLAVDKPALLAASTDSDNDIWYDVAYSDQAKKRIDRKQRVSAMQVDLVVE